MANEFEWAAMFAADFGVSKECTTSGLEVGIGDDCALLAPPYFDLVTTDTLVEDVHFSTQTMSAEDIGFRSLAASLSDVAAMGGVPGIFFVNLSIPKSYDSDTRDSFIKEFYKGISTATDVLVPSRWKTISPVIPAGGDTTSSPGPLVITITLMGRSPKLATESGIPIDLMGVGDGGGVSSLVWKTAAGGVLRSGGGVGDHIFVTGTLGDSAAGLRLLSSLTYCSSEENEFLIQRHRRPDARVEFGFALGVSRVATAMLDCSDGFIQDLEHLLRASKVDAKIDIVKIPISPQLKHFLGDDSPLPLALTGGEDFELIFTVKEEDLPFLETLTSSFGVEVHDVGVLTEPVSYQAHLYTSDLDRSGELADFMIYMEKYGKGYLHF